MKHKSVSQKIYHSFIIIINVPIYGDQKVDFV